MLYSIVSQDVADSLALRKSYRPDHIARLQALSESGRLLLAGPNPADDTDDLSATTFTGSIIIAEFDSLEDAQEWASKDPYLLHGVYASVAVKPYLKVLP